jgi:N-acetylglucosamine-6-sulfatase
MQGSGVRRVAGAVGLLLLAACTQQAAPQAEPPEPTGLAQPLPAIGTRPSIDAAEVVEPERPNIVLVLLDDVSMDLVPTMRNVRRMQRRGAAYSHSFVVDSLCCVSRASLLTGQYPHQTGVLTNTANTPNEVGPVGGWEAFSAYGNPERSVNVALQEAGYATGFVGKFLNQYEPHLDPLPVPPGWTQWNAIFGSAYDGWDFESSYLDDGELRIREYLAPHPDASDEEKDAAYVGTVTSELALDFIEEHQDDEAPYFLEIAPYATHGRVGPQGAYADDPVFPPAMQDRPRPGRPDGNCGLVACSDLGIDDVPGFGDDPGDNAPRRADGSVAPAWRPQLPAPRAEDALRAMRNRARMVQSVDRMLGEVLAAVDDDTYVVFTSDNGFHLGQHSLGSGKGSAYDSDVHVPLVVVGPGVRPGTREELVTNLDLAPTFERLAGLRPAAYRSGRSLLPSLHDPASRRRDAVIIEHTWAPSLGADPDKAYSGGTIDKIPSYVAARSADGLLVRVDLDNSWAGTDYAWEFYDYRELPWERTNQYAERRRTPAVALLRREIERFDRCTELTRDDPVPARCR